MNGTRNNPGIGPASAGVLAALLLTACSGGGSGDRLPSDRLSPDADPDAAAAATQGRWLPAVDWPLLPIHVVLLPDGRVLSYGSTKPPAGGDTEITGGLQYDLWTPDAAADAHTTLPNFTSTDLFCNAQLVLPQPDAGVLLVGGDTFPRREPVPDADPADGDEPPEDNDDGNSDSVVFDYRQTDTLSAGPQMNRGRWYGSATTLVNGEVYIQGGRSFTQASGVDHPEIRGQDGRFRLLDGADTSALRYYYPRNFVMRDGRLFGFDTSGQMYRVDSGGAGSVSLLGRFDALYRGDDSTAAMFRPGRILQFGGNDVEGDVTGASLVIDANGAVPRLTPSGELSSLRRLSSATLLPDGRVLATGGSVAYNELRGVNRAAEIWDPVSGEWTLGAQAEFPRLYHSSALLLQDGSVLVGGGGLPGPEIYLNAERYLPPYLFTAQGRLAPRPRLGAPDSLAVRRSFTLTYGAAGTEVSVGTADAARVTLLKTGSQTHHLNMEQRFIELPFTALDSRRLDVRMPSAAGEVPPGYYLLFVIDRAGVPSVGKFVFVNVADAPDATQDPSLAAPADRAGTVGVADSLSLEASDPNATPLRFAAAGLPPGLAVDASSGRVAGTPGAAGSYDVVVSASDGARTASANFVWTVTEATAP